MPESCNCSVKTFGVNFHFSQIEIFSCFQAVIGAGNFLCPEHADRKKTIPVFSSEKNGIVIFSS